MASSSNHASNQHRSRQLAGNPSRGGQPPPSRPPRRPEPQPDQLSYEEQHRILSSLTHLESNELLVWSAIARNESLPQTRLHFERDMLFPGSDSNDDEDDGSVEWEDSRAMDEEDQKRLRSGIAFGAAGWFDPREHVDAAQRVEMEREKEKEKERRKKADEGVKREGKGESPRGPRARRSTGGGSAAGSRTGTPNKGKASGKRPASSDSLHS